MEGDPDSSERLLFVDAALFLAVSVVTFWEVMNGTRELQRLKHGLTRSLVEIEDERTPGAEMRRMVQWSLAIATASRGTLLMVEQIVSGSPGIGLRALPEMLYLTTYYAMAYFWAQLAQALATFGSIVLRRLLITGAGFIWVAYFVNLIYMYLAEPTNPRIIFVVGVCFEYMMGVATAALFVANGVYVACVAVPARRQRSVLWRTVTIGVTCSAALAARSATYFALASSGKVDLSDVLPPAGIACYLAVVELLPSVVILGLTKRRHSGMSPGSNVSRNSTSLYGRVAHMSNTSMMSSSSTLLGNP